jgi:hypothetical protein
MSAEISLHLKPAHVNKLTKGKSFQLKANELHEALNNDANCVLHMANKHIGEILRNHNNGKGCRISHEKIIGGHIN